MLVIIEVIPAIDTIKSTIFLNNAASTRARVDLTVWRKGEVR